MAYFEGKDLRSAAQFPSNPDLSSYLFMKDKDSSQTWGLRVGDSGDFAVHQSSVADRLNILSNGNVGIGTISPSNKLTIQGNDAAIIIGDQDGIASNAVSGIQFADAGFKHVGLRYQGGQLILEDASRSNFPSTWYNNAPADFVVRNGNILAGGTIKSGFNRIYVTITQLSQTQPGCENLPNGGTGWTYMQCYSACNRLCKAQSYSGGTITEWDGAGNSAECICIP